MMRYLLPLLLCFSCANQQQDTEQPIAEWTPPVIEGQWKFVSAVKVEDARFLSDYQNPNTPALDEGPKEPPYSGPDIIFEQDSMYLLDFPIQLLARNSFSLDSGYLNQHFEWYTASFPIELVNDTLFIYKPLYGKEYVKEGYVKTSFNDSILDILIKEEVNYPELAGTWFLIRESSGGDGTYYELDFPYEIPDSIQISRAEFISGLNNKMIYLMATDGKKREYYFEFSGSNLYFTPGEWYQGEDPWIHFTKW